MAQKLKRMAGLKALAGLLLVAWAFMGSQCISAGRLDPKMVARYQRAMAQRGPQTRASRDGISSLQPVTVPPELKVVQDPKTGIPRVELTLDEAIRRALANNIDIKIVSFDPAISREAVIEAAAEFDMVVFGGFNYDKRDRRTDNAFDTGQSLAKVWNAGLRQKTVTGAEWSLEWAWTRSWDDLRFRTWPTRHEPTLQLQIAQPLLRDAWPQFNLARTAVARLNHRTSLAKFRQRVEEVITEVITMYWRLAQARLDMKIQKSLLDKTTATYKRTKLREDLDATNVQIKQAASAVESRKAALIRARKGIADAQDLLARLLADRQVNVLANDNLHIIPATSPHKGRVVINATDELVSALRHNAQVEQARLAISVANVAVHVAKNQTLPRLDVTTSGSLQGLHPARNQAHDDLTSGAYASYAVGISLEYPVGNRERRSALRQRRFERLKAITTLQNTADQVAVAVNERVRQIATAFQEMRAQQAAVAAATIQLEAIEETERTRAKLTPEFLQLKLSAQESLAQAERAELQATIDYNTAMTDLDAATGTILEKNQVRIQDVVNKGDLSGLHAIPLPRVRAPR